MVENRSDLLLGRDHGIMTGPKAGIRAFAVIIWETPGSDSSYCLVSKSRGKCPATLSCLRKLNRLCFLLHDTYLRVTYLRASP
jgi:hypothetical protein